MPNSGKQKSYTKDPKFKCTQNQNSGKDLMQTDGTAVTVLLEYIFGQNRSDKSEREKGLHLRKVQAGGIYRTK